MAEGHYNAGGRRQKLKTTSLKTTIVGDTSKMDIDNEDMRVTFIKAINSYVPQIIPNETGMKYLEPKGRKIPHYRLMKIFHSMKRASMESDVAWWHERIKLKGVPQCFWMAEIVASATDLLWRGFGHYVPMPNLDKKNDQMEDVIRKWCECMLKIKHMWFGALEEIARSCPEVVWTVMEPMETRTAAPVSSSFSTATQMLNE